MQKQSQLQICSEVHKGDNIKFDNIQKEGIRGLPAQYKTEFQQLTIFCSILLIVFLGIIHDKFSLLMY